MHNKHKCTIYSFNTIFPITDITHEISIKTRRNYWYVSSLLLILVLEKYVFHIIYSV